MTNRMAILEGHYTLQCISEESVATPRSETTYRKLQRYPVLLSHVCHIDLYQDWEHDAYISVAEHWLRDNSAKVSREYLTTVKIIIICSPKEFDPQLVPGVLCMPG